MEYLYYLANTSLTLRVIDFLRSHQSLPVQFITVIHQIDGWIVKIKMRQYLTPQCDASLPSGCCVSWDS